MCPCGKAKESKTHVWENVRWTKRKRDVLKEEMGRYINLICNSLVH